MEVSQSSSLGIREGLNLSINLLPASAVHTMNHLIIWSECNFLEGKEDLRYGGQILFNLSLALTFIRARTHC